MSDSAFNKRVKGILEDLIKPLCIFLEQNLQEHNPNWWEEIALNSLTDEQRRFVQIRNINNISGLDLAALIRIFDNNWHLIYQKQEILPEFRNILKEMRSVRNRWAHAGEASYPREDIYRDLDTINRFAGEIGADIKLLNNIRKTMREVLNESSLPMETQYSPVHSGITIQDYEPSYLFADVLSVAAGKTKRLIDRYHIHSCPNRYSYKPTRYITFRAGGTGKMDALYEISKILIIPVSARDNLKTLENHGLSSEEVQRLRMYIQENPFADNDRFYILSYSRALPKNPPPQEINAKTLYYSIDELS